MAGFRSILWVGEGAGLDGDLVTEAPSIEFTWARDVDEAIGLPPDAFDAAVLDVPDAASAAAGLRRLRARLDDLPILVRVPHLDTPARHALRAVGAAEVVASADVAEEPGGLIGRIGEVVARHRGAALSPPRRLVPTRRRDGAAPPALRLVGDGPAMRAVLSLVQRAARSHATVLLSGETGTGKELLARAIHDASPRHARPFVAVNCAAFPEALLESELFGHLRGSFTGADRDKKGLFEEADGGTIFLDEIGETPLAIQAKLLRVLQEREVRPVGGVRSKRVDVRVVAATNRTLRDEVATGAFREDLFYRLAVFPIRVPPLRERPEDVLVLANHFLGEHARREGVAPSPIAADAKALLQGYAWPGNVRELENEIQRALALAEHGEALSAAHLSERLGALAEPADSAAHDGETLRETLGRIEALLIRRALDALGGRRAATARKLGITREGLYKKMRRFHID